MVTWCLRTSLAVTLRLQLIQTLGKGDIHLYDSLHQLMPVILKSCISSVSAFFFFLYEPSKNLFVGLIGRMRLQTR